MAVESKVKRALAVGQMWKDAVGNTSVILEFRAEQQCPFIDQDGNSFSATGRFQLNVPGNNDLVEFVSDGWHSVDAPVLNSTVIEPYTRSEGVGAAQPAGHVLFDDVIAYRVVPQQTATTKAEDASNDADKLASETLVALGWHFDGQAWIDANPVDLVEPGVKAHPLYPVYLEAIAQAMHGKGERHGGNVTPFLDQPWVHYVTMHGRGFATGQSAKKLEEAASLREGKAFDDEVLGAIVYAGMSILKNRDVV